MESQSLNHIIEDAEFSSNESGWTKYIASPAPGENLSGKVNDNSKEEDDDEHRDASRKRDDQHNDDDNDSVASDASSGPGHFVEIIEDGYANSYTKYSEDEENFKFYSGKKGHREVKERSARVADEARRNDPIFKGNTATGYVLKQKQGKKNKRGEK